MGDLLTLMETPSMDPKHTAIAILLKTSITSKHPGQERQLPSLSSSFWRDLRRNLRIEAV